MIILTLGKPATIFGQNLACTEILQDRGFREVVRIKSDEVFKDTIVNF